MSSNLKSRIVNCIGSEFEIATWNTKDGTWVATAKLHKLFDLEFTGEWIHMSTTYDFARTQYESQGENEDDALAELVYLMNQDMNLFEEQRCAK